jgi:hypothetical protein
MVLDILGVDILDPMLLQPQGAMRRYPPKVKSWPKQLLQIW